MKKIIGRISIIALVMCLLSGLLGAVASAQAPSAPSQAYTFKSVVTGTSGGYMPGIIFNETQANLIYARTDMGGAYRWNEASQSWTQLLNWVSTDMWNDTGVDALATDPVDPNRLYLLAGTYTNAWAPTLGAILRSTDKGNTFTRIGLPFKVGANMLGRALGPRLVIDPNKNSNLWLGARSGNGLLRSTDFGSTWTQVSFPDVGQYSQVPGDVYQGDIMGIAWIAIDKSTGTPGNASQTLYVGVGDPTGANIYRSTNGGTSWSALPGQLTCSLSGSTVTCSNGVSWTNTNDACPNHMGQGLIPHHGTISPDGFLYVNYSNTLGPYDGDIGEIYKLNIATGAWTRITPVIPGANGDCSNGVLDRLTGFGGLAIDRQNPQRLLVSELNRWWPDANLWRSTDGGATWSSAWTESWPPNFNAHYNGPDISSAPWLNFDGKVYEGDPPSSVKLGWMIGDIQIDPFNSDRFFYGTGATVYGATNLNAWDTGGKVNIRSMGKGMEQTSVLGMISPPSGTTRLFTVMGDIGGFKHTNLDAAPAEMYRIPYSGTFNAIDYAELNPQFMVRVGTGNPNVGAPRQPYHGAAFTFDGGSSWFQSNNDPVWGQGGGTVAAAANASRVLWAGSNVAVSYSTDNGNAWIASQGIPQNSVVASDRVNPSKFYGLGPNGTFYVSTNGGANFSATASGLPTFGEVKAVPGVEGDIWVVGGDSSTLPTGMWHSINSGATFTKLANVQAASSIGFGKAAPGQSYPAIFAAAKIDNLNTIHRSDDGGASWVRITDDQHMYATIQTITGDPTIYGRVYFGTNGLGAVYGDIAGILPPTSTPTRTSTPGIITNTPTRTATATRTNTPLGPTFTPTRTLTPAGPTFTPTRTATRTNTPLGPSATPTRTATRTNTPVGPTATPTRTLTPVSGATCSPVTSTITAPFVFDGAGTFCWQSSNLGAFINSWNLASLTINGVNITNVYVPASAYPAKINGFWYVSYTGNFPWSHFEAK